MMLIPEAPRHWDYGTPQFVPSESEISTKIKIEPAKERMIEPLPEGKTIKE
jgi:hypothetical protein